MILGGLALDAGPRWFGPYRDASLAFMGASAPLLFVGIRAGNRSLAAAQVADRGLPA